MRIGIDARFYGERYSGIGRYVKNLVLELEKIDQENKYVVFLRSENFNLYKPKNENFQKMILDTHPYSIKSQLVDWFKIRKLKLDLVHFTHFSYPIFYQGKFVITVHDLIKNEFYDKGVSTRSWVFYKLKHFGYNLVLKCALGKSIRIITPTKFVKEEIVKNYRIKEEKIVPVYEGAEDKFLISNFQFSSKKTVLKKYSLEKQKYLLYVGNVYPYKNVERLLKVMKEIKETKNQGMEKLQLAIVCSRSVFYDRIQRSIEKIRLQDTVRMLGFVPDEDLALLYNNALAFITATLSEGFGITGLEAMAAECPVLSSNKSCLPEVYGSAALFFDPQKNDEIIEKIKRIQNSELRSQKIKQGKRQVENYSWKKMAVKILDMYNSVG